MFRSALTMPSAQEILTFQSSLVQLMQHLEPAPEIQRDEKRPAPPSSETKNCHS
jgi:hypothetical protein